MSKKLLAGIVLVATALSCSAFAMTQEEEDEAWKKEPAYGKVINVGYNGGLCLSTFGIAQIKGFYAAEGLETKTVRYSGGGTASIDAVGTGKVDVVGDHIATLLVPTVNGIRMKFTTGVHSGCKSIYVPTDSTIQKTSDLVGKYLAIPDGIGGSDQNISMRFLSHDGVDPRQVKWKVAESGVAIMAMQKGEVQGALLSDQFAKKFMDTGEIRPIRSLTWDEDFKKEPCCIHAVNLDFYNANPITVKKLTRAHEAASAWMMEHPEEAVKALQEQNWCIGDFDFVLEIFKTYNFNISDELTEIALRNIIDDYKSFGMIDKKKSTDDIMERIWDPVLQAN